MTPNIIFEVNNNLAKITLNRPKALNALSKDMFIQLQAQLLEWENNAAIKAVIIRSNCEKAFCAGGDIRAIYENRQLSADVLSEYFRLEYGVNRLIAHFSKPFIALTHGITMGGGVGISLHGSHCVAAENLRWAMPETLIGFFPDVAATYYLGRLPNYIGAYLSLTGNIIDARTALKLQLIKFAVAFKDFDALEKKLTETPFDASDFEAVTKMIHLFSLREEKINNTLPENEIAACFCFSTVEEILQALNNVNNDWSQETVKQLLHRSPTSLKVTLQQLRVAKNKSIDEVSAMDFLIAYKMLERHDFYEGIRAAIIDKDKNPHWKPKKLSEVSNDAVNQYF